MNKYVILGLAFVVVVVLGVTVIAFNPGNKSDTKVLGSASSFSSLAPTDFNKALSSGKYKLIDIRTIEEFNAGHIKNAENADYYQTQQFSDFLDSLDKNAKYLIYCQSGRRSGLTLQLMKQKGFTNVNDLASGINSWKSSGLPL